MKIGLVDSIATVEAPAAIGSYSQGIVVRGNYTLLFTSGQLPISVGTGTLVEGDISTACFVALSNAFAIVRAAGGEITDVVRATLYVVDMSKYEAINRAYAEAFGDHRPARSIVGVQVLPRGADVEVELVAAIPNLDEGNHHA